MTIRRTVICDECGKEIAGDFVHIQNDVMSSHSPTVFNQNTSPRDYHLPCWAKVLGREEYDEISFDDLDDEDKRHFADGWLGFGGQ